MAVMNELEVSKGDLDVKGSIAFAAQQPWIFSGTVRQNIIFGKEYKKEWYQTVIKACGIHTVSIYQNTFIKMLCNITYILYFPSLPNLTSNLMLLI